MAIRTAATILAEMVASFLARTGYSDMRPGDPILQAFSQVSEQLAKSHADIQEGMEGYHFGSARGDYARAKAGDVLPYGLEPWPAQRAQGGAVVFQRPAGVATTINIYRGHPVGRSSDGFQYVTAADVQVLPGNTTSGSTSVVATQPGSAGNCDVGDIDSMIEPVDGITQVRNTASIQNGLDQESDGALLERTRRHVAGIATGNRSAIRGAILDIESATYGRVLFCQVGRAEATNMGGRVDVYIDDGWGTAGPLQAVASEILIDDAAAGDDTFYSTYRPIAPPDGGDYTLEIDSVEQDRDTFEVVDPWGMVRLLTPLAGTEQVELVGFRSYQGLVAEAQKAVDGLFDLAAEYPGKRAVGGTIRVLPATKVPVTVAGLLTYDGSIGDIDAVRAAAQTITVAIVNGSDIGPAKLKRASIIDALMGLPGISNVRRVRFNSAESDFSVPAGSVARTTNADVFYTP